MAYTASLRFEQQLSGSNINTWGDRLDNTLARVDDAIAGFVTLSIAASGDYTVQSANDNASSDEARRAFLKLSGSPSSNFQVIITPVSKAYKVWNATAKAATVTTGSGSTVTIDAGDILDLWSDGSNVKQITLGGLGLKDFIAASVLAATGSLPAVTGNAGKYLFTDGVNSFWRQPSTADLSDYARLILGVQVALAVAL